MRKRLTFCTSRVSEDRQNGFVCVRSEVVRRGARGASLIAVCLLVLNFNGSSCAVGAEPSPEELATMALDGVRANYAHIESARFRIVETLETAPEIAGEISTKLPGGVAKFSMDRLRRWNLDVLVQGDAVRVERRSAELPETVAEELHAFIGGRWTQYVPSASAAWIRNVYQGPSMLSIDPRQLGSDDVRISLEQTLAQDHILSAALKSDAGAASVLTIVSVSPHGTRVTRDFDGELGFLPVRFATHWPDGSLMQLIEYEYQPVLSGQAQLLKKLTRRFFAQGAAKSPHDAPWRQRITREVAEISDLNVPQDANAFTLDLPRGTRVVDNLRGVIYAVGEGLDAVEPRSSSWTIAATALTFVALVALKIHRRFSWFGKHLAGENR